MREGIGPVAAFKLVAAVERLPKTRSGKILRGTMKKIADGREYKVPATIDDPAIRGLGSRGPLVGRRHRPPRRPPLPVLAGVVPNMAACGPRVHPRLLRRPCEDSRWLWSDGLV